MNNSDPAPLMPCPQCSGPAEMNVWPIDCFYPLKGNNYAVRCSRCRLSQFCWKSPEIAAEAWNTRPQSPANAALVEALERIADLGASLLSLNAKAIMGDPNAVGYMHQHIARQALAAVRGKA